MPHSDLLFLLSNVINWLLVLVCSSRNIVTSHLVHQGCFPEVAVFAAFMELFLGGGVCVCVCGGGGGGGGGG